MLTYKDAGVDIAQADTALDRIKKHVASTYTKNVVTKLGGFGSGFSLQKIATQYTNPILVQSMDGVGTKTIVARMANQFDFLGQDLLSACTNDILVMGAKPLTFLDYLASANLDPNVIEAIIKGLSDECRKHAISLVGGEMAQMPDTYLPHEWDIVGIVSGVVAHEKMITGDNIESGDLIIGLSSTGLHTNGYSLARKLLFEVAQYKIDDHIDSIGTTLAHALLAPHQNYCQPIHDLLNHDITINGMVHITGGGFWDNIPRILPKTLGVDIYKNNWPKPDIFNLLIEIGDLDEQQAFHTFNMGIGYLIILSEKSWEKAKPILESHPECQAYPIGKVVNDHQTVRLLS